MSTTETVKAKKAEKVESAPKEKVQLTVSQILQDLKNGIGRKEIQKRYGLSLVDLKRLFSHPKLKGMKVKPVPQFELTDDTPNKDGNAVGEVAENTEEVTDTDAKSAKSDW